MLLVVAGLVYILAGLVYSSQDVRLKAHLLNTTNYNYIARPSQSKMFIDYNLDVIGVLSVEMADSKIVFKVNVQMSWVDPRLTWSPADYGGLEESVFTTHGDKQIWTPELSLMNSDGKSLFPKLDQSGAIVHNDGVVVWNRPGNIELIQKFVLRDFPFEIQEVNMVTEIHAYRIESMELRQWKDDIKKYRIPGNRTGKIVDNIQWGIKSIEESTLDTTNMSYSAISYKVRLKRKGESTLNVMYLPALMVSSLALFSFFIPIDQVVRIQFTTTLLLTLIMLLLMVTRFLPITSENPLIEQIFVGLVTIVFSCDLFVVMIAFYKKRYDENMASLKTEKKKPMIPAGRKTNLNLLINVEELTNIQMKNQESNGSVESLVSISQSSSDNETIKKKQSIAQFEQIDTSHMSKTRRFCNWLAQPTVIDKLFFLFISLYFLGFLVSNYIQVRALMDK